MRGGTKPTVSEQPSGSVGQRVEGSADVGTDSAPVQNLVLEGVSRGREADTIGVSKAMGMSGTSDEDDAKEVARLSINEAKARIRALHVVFDDLIAAFKAAPHRKQRDDALESDDKAVVHKHLRDMLKRVRAYYSGGPSGMRVGIVIPAEVAIQQLLGGAAAAAAPVVAPAAAAAPAASSSTPFSSLGGRMPEHPGSVLHKKGSDPYGAAMSIAVHRRKVAWRLSCERASPATR